MRRHLLSALFVASWLSVAAPSKHYNRGVCRHSSFSCQCGTPGYTLHLPVKQCLYIHRWKVKCLPCNNLKKNEVCPKLKHCKECDSEGKGCRSCPPGRYGHWCEKRCQCHNGGTCDPKTGACACAAPFTGTHCEKFSGTTCQEPPVPSHGKVEYQEESGGGLKTGRQKLRRSLAALDTPLRAALPPGHFRVGTLATFSCANRFYRLVGSEVRRCLPDGSWTGRTATCIPVCGRSNSPRTSLIYHGNVKEIGQWPWQVALFIRFEGEQAWRVKCGGTLLSESWVVTAAHCVTKRRGRKLVASSALRFYFGKYYRDDALDDAFVQIRTPQEIHVHEDYDPVTYDADIAMVLLDRPVELTSRVQPICLPSKRTSQLNIVHGNLGVITGWGLTENQSFADVLRQAVIPVVSVKECERAYREGRISVTVTPNMFCGGYVNGHVDACMGDSGGPFAFMSETVTGQRVWVLEGIVSWGGPRVCGVPNYFGGYTKVAVFVEWIRQFL
ncbi:clotting factor C-like [Haemaphysalis longicornis]